MTHDRDGAAHDLRPDLDGRRPGPRHERGPIGRTQLEGGKGSGDRDGQGGGESAFGRAHLRSPIGWTYRSWCRATQRIAKAGQRVG